MKIMQNAKKVLISIVPPLLVGKSCLDIFATETARKYHLLLKKKKYDAYQFTTVAKMNEGSYLFLD